MSVNACVGEYTRLDDVVVAFVLSRLAVLYRQKVTHPSSNRARCRATGLIEANVLTTTLRRHPKTRVCFRYHLPYGITQCYLPPDTSELAVP